MKMLLILLLFQATITRGKYVAIDKSYDLFQEKLLHKSSNEIAHMFTVPPGEKEITLDFNFDSQEHTNIRRSADIRLRDEPLVENDETNKEISNKTENDSRFTKNLYECMIPEGEIKKPTTLAVISFLSSLNETDPQFEITEDRMKWFSIGNIQKKKENSHVIFQIELLVIEGSNIISSASADSLYEFVIEAKQNDMKVNSTVQVEILSLSPTTLRPITTTQQTTTNSNIIEGSAEEIEGSGDAFIEAFTSATLISDEPRNVSVENKIKSDDMGSGESFEKNENLLLQQRTSSDIAEPDTSDDQPLTENLTSSSTPAMEDLAATANDVPEKKGKASSLKNKLYVVILGLEIVLNGTTNGVYTVPDQEHLSRGDLLKGLSFSLHINDEKSLKKISLTIDRNDLFALRPNRIPTNAKAYLFLKNANIQGDIVIKVTAKDEETGMTSSEIVTIRKLSSKQSSKHSQSNQLTTVVFNVNENVPSGTTLGKIPNGNDMMIVSKASIFALVGEDLLLSCTSEMPCLDYEKQTVHYVLLQNKNGSMPMLEIVINVNDMNDHVPQLSVTDEVVRILDNRLIGAFAIEVLDRDMMSPNEISLDGTASNFLAVESVDRNLYQLIITGNAKTGRHELQIILTDGNSRIEKTIRVIVLRGSSHAHFRRSRYERLVKIEQIEKDEELIRVELEGIPIDEAKFVILKGNPGWIKMDDYGGSLIVSSKEKLTPSAQLTVGAISRQNGQLLAETVVVLNVIGVPEIEKTDDVFVKKMYEKTLDRERSEKLEFELNVRNDHLDSKIVIKRNSIFALDENAQIKEIPSNAISVEGNKVMLSKEEAKDLRIVRFDIECKDQKATVIFHLNSSEDYVLHRKRMDNRPVFPSPWTFETQEVPREVSIPEELPVGQVIFLAPALNPLNGKLVESRIVEGENDFKLDVDTGAIHVIRQFDFDSMMVEERTKQLKIVSGEKGYESIFKAIVHIADIDDNPPSINRDGIPNQIILPENLPINTTIAKILVSDIDEISISKGLQVSIEGEHSDLYKALVVNGTIVVNVAGLLDREKAPSNSLTLSVFDSAGNEDYISMTVILFDENDNVPQFAHKNYDVQVVENWPSGLVIEQLVADDDDVGANSELTFSLVQAEIDYFSINATSGQLLIKHDLLGVSREEPYTLIAMVQDNGNPPLNSTVTIRIKILEKTWDKNEGYIDFVDPPFDFISILPENTKLNEVVYQAKAQVRTRESGRQHMHIKYSITENGTDSDIFKIDESTGEIILAKALDFENKRDHFLIIKAEHLLLNSSNSRLWRVEVENSNDNTPVFINSSSFIFTLRSIVPIGRLSAFDIDGDQVYYQIIPSCSPYSKFFTIDEEFGEITFNRKEDDIKEHRVYLCAIARSENTLLDPELQFDSRRSDMIKFIVEKEHEQQFIIPDMTAYNNTIITLDPLLQQVSIPVNQQTNPPSLGHYKLNSSIIRVQYTPCADMLPATTTKTALNQLFMLDDETNTVRVSPKLATEHDGIYKVSLATHSPNGTYMINQEYHLINKARKSKFVFDLPASELSRNIRGFERRLSAALSSDHPSLPMKIVADKPMSLNNNRTRSFVCFHTIKDGKIVSPDTALSSLSINNVGSVSHLAQLYSKYHIIDIQECGEEASPVASASIFSNPVMGLSTILIYTAICLAILLPFALIIYCCAIRRYRDYIIAKEKSLKTPLSDVSHSPSLQPTPTFLLGPSAVTPMGPIGYWD